MLPYYFLKVYLEIFLVQAFELFDNYIIKLVYKLVKKHQVLLLFISSKQATELVYRVFVPINASVILVWFTIVLMKHCNLSGSSFYRWYKFVL